MNNERAYDRIQKLSADELADKIMKEIWADFPMGSEKGLLIEAAVDKLREIPKMEKNYLSAVQGRRDFRAALKEERARG